MTQTVEKYNWISSVPFGWKLVKLKYLSSISTGVYDTQDKLKDGKFPFFVRSPHVERIDKYSHDCEAVMTAGDGVGVGKVFHYYNGKFAAHQRVYVFNQFKSNVNGKYIYYSLMSNLKLEVLQGNAKSTVDSLRYPMLSNFPILLPSSSIQTTIVDFLERKTSEIDALISDKEKLIALLEEKRQAIITEAVTKGLDPDVKMKDSGVEWIGDIPEHWNMKKLRFLGRFQNGISKSAEYFGHGSPFVSYGDVYNNFELPIAVNGLVDSTQLEKEAYSVKSGDVFFTRTSETVDEIGLASTCMKSIEGATFAGFLIRFRPFTGKLVPQFSKFYFRNQLSRKYFVKEMNIVTRASLGQNLLKNYPVILPPITEQNTIANYLESINEQTDKLIQENKYTVEKLKEYRQALIYEAVTGKIDVQEMVKETEQEEVSSS